MPYNHFEPFSKQVTIVVGLTVVGFMAFGLALSFYRNALFEQTLNNLTNRNNVLEQQIQNDQRELEYYKSAQYKDKYAKENLGFVQPGEKILIITKESADYTQENHDDASLTEQQEAAYLELLRQMPPLEHWKLYLFHRDQLEELRETYRTL